MRVAVTGAGGQLGADLAVVLAEREHDAILLDSQTMDCTDARAVEGVFRGAIPDVVIHAAAWTDVDACELDPDRAQLVNADACRTVARFAGHAFVIVVSTDYVFDGTLGRAYTERDEPEPLQVYGRTKLEGERFAAAANERVAIARTAWLYGARRGDGMEARNFVTAILRGASRGPLDVVDDQVGSPTSTGDLARALVSLAEQPTPGVFNVVNAGAVSRYDFARAIVERARLDPALVRPISTKDAPPRHARRPAYAPLDPAAWSAAGYQPLPSWDDALSRMLADLDAGR